MVKGSYERVKEKCPECGKICYLPLHAKYCKGPPLEDPGKLKNPDVKEFEIKEAPDVQTEESESITEKITSWVHDIKLVPGREEDLFLDFESDSLSQKTKDNLKKGGKAVKKVVEDSTIADRETFDNLFGYLNKLFDVMGMPYYKLTEDEIKLITPDLYYLLKKYYPDVLKWLNNDFVIAGRLLLNIVTIARTKIIQGQIIKGTIKAEDVDSEMWKALNDNPEFQDMKDMFGGLGEALKDLSQKSSSSGSNTEENGIKIYDHSGSN